MSKGRALFFLLIATILGCGDDADSWPSGRPHIVELKYLDQSPKDVYALQFSIAFEDTDGDVGAGLLELSVNGDVAAESALSEIFEAQHPPMQTSATQGVFLVQARVESSVKVGDEVEIGFVLEDEGGQRSNTPSVTVRVVDPGGRS